MNNVIKQIGKFYSQIKGDTMAAVGTANTGVTATHFGNTKDITTVLTFTDLEIGIGGSGAALGIGKLIYTFPAGAHCQVVSYMDINFIEGNSDTIDAGIGSVIASGVISVLGGTATFEDYITGQTVITGPGGTNCKKTSVATAGALIGISINEAASVKTIHLNAAANWAVGGVAVRTLTATGTITIKWVKLS